MKKERPYVGEIKNAGSQVVKGAFVNSGAKHGTVKKGNDLRTGTSGSAKK